MSAHDDVDALLEQSYALTAQKDAVKVQLAELAAQQVEVNDQLVVAEKIVRDEAATADLQARWNAADGDATAQGTLRLLADELGLTIDEG